MKSICFPAIAAAAILVLAPAATAFAAEAPATPADGPAPPEAKTDATPDAETKPAKPRVELAILLDTSGSMSGLINQARAHLWEIVNEFEGARRGGQRPDVYVALYEYGNDGLSADNGYVRQIVPLTLDLDKISEKLFALTTNGGSEYCGQVIKAAVDELKWTEGSGVLRSIFIAGNEPFTQGPVDYRTACSEAAARGITVSTIHCGDEATGVREMWADGAKLADGAYLAIDHNQQVPQIEAPQDAEIARLSSELNSTYVAYGERQSRLQAVERQQAQDTNAASLAPAAASNRALTKASANYRNSHWCLVDAVCEKRVKLEDVPEDQLPENMRKMTLEERKAYLDEMSQRRAKLQEQIKQLGEERAKFVAAERAKLPAPASSLDTAIGQAVQAQAAEQGFDFE